MIEDQGPLNIKASTVIDEAKIKEPKKTLGKLFLFGVMALAMSSFGPMALVAAAPLTLAFIIYGRSQTFIMTIALSLIILLLDQFFIKSAQLSATVIVFAFGIGNAFLLSKVIEDNEHPSRGFIRTGCIAVGVLVLMATLSFALKGTSILSYINQLVDQMIVAIKSSPAHEQLISAGGEEARALKDFITNPEQIVKEIYHWSFAWIFISVFLGVWASLFLVLRSAVTWNRQKTYQYSLSDFVTFKASEYLIIPLVLALVLMILSGNVFGELSLVVGGNILYCTGVFYFLQGFGIFLDFLKYVGMSGFFKTLLIVLTVLTAWKFLAIIGLFDMWLNFRKYLNKKNEDKGDSI